MCDTKGYVAFVEACAIAGENDPTWRGASWYFYTFLKTPKLAIRLCAKHFLDAS